MIEFLDANAILRYLTKDPLDQFLRAQALIDGPRDFAVTDVALSETAYVLNTTYRQDRARIVDVLVEFVRKENIHIHNLDRDVVVQALMLCKPSNRVNVGDAMIWAAVRCAGAACIHSFDQRFPAEDIDVRRP